jgi:S-(hydroxymethyl)glutathione dehydrogenase/alcohol dehydrogenase
MYPKKMRAAILTELNSALLITDQVEIPQIGPHQVLVKLRFSGICHSQLMEQRGKRGKDDFLPHLLGHEGSGIVVAIGSKITKVREGDKVLLTWIQSEGIDGPPPLYRWNGNTLNAGRVTTFNEFSLVSENRVVKQPLGIPEELVWLLGCAVPTGAGMVLNMAKPSSHHTVAIFGLGGVGLSALMAAEALGVKQIIAVDIHDEKLQMGRAFGATDLINAKYQNPTVEIYRMTEGSGVDFAFDASGTCAVIETAFKSVKKNGGKCIFASHPEAGHHIKLDPFDLICGKKIEGSWGGETKPDRDLIKYGEFYGAGKFPFEKLKPTKYRLAEINSALADLENGNVSRAYIDFLE